MPSTPTRDIVPDWRRVPLSGSRDGLTDSQLLEAFRSRRDGAAFAALVRRHGPLVWGVCRRLLRSHHDAEDAFQATFLVLVRKAASVRSSALLANWLYGVAYQTARKARAVAARRAAREQAVGELPEPAVTDDVAGADLRPLLDRELHRLPDRYRAVVVLCDLQETPRRQAARLLGVPEGTVASRLTRARAILARRLARLDPGAPGVAAAVLSAHLPTSGGVPATLIHTTARAAGQLMTRPAVTASVLSLRVAALTNGVLTSMLLTKLKTAAVVLLALTTLGVAATGVAYRAAAAESGDADGVPRRASAPAVREEGPPDAELRRLKAELQRLRAENEALRRQVRTLEDERRQASAAGRMAPPPAADASDLDRARLAWATRLFRETDHDFGTCERGDPLTHRFRITNIYAVPLDLDVRTGCGCLQTSLNPSTLKPGETGELEVVLDTRRFTGTKVVKVYVTATAPGYSSTATLTVKASN